jgi:hypothetical protein
MTLALFSATASTSTALFASFSISISISFTSAAAREASHPIPVIFHGPAHATAERAELLLRAVVEVTPAAAEVVVPAAAAAAAAERVHGAFGHVQHRHRFEGAQGRFAAGLHALPVCGVQALGYSWHVALTLGRERETKKRSRKNDYKNQSAYMTTEQGYNFADWAYLKQH